MLRSVACLVVFQVVWLDLSLLRVINACQLTVSSDVMTACWEVCCAHVVQSCHMLTGCHHWGLSCSATLQLLRVVIENTWSPCLHGVGMLNRSREWIASARQHLTVALCFMICPLSA
jgi:hypothetical protein